MSIFSIFRLAPPRAYQLGTNTLNLAYITLKLLKSGSTNISMLMSTNFSVLEQGINNQSNRFVRNFMTIKNYFLQMSRQNCGIHIKKSDYMFWQENHTTYHWNAACQLLQLYNLLWIMCLSVSMQMLNIVSCLGLWFGINRLYGEWSNSADGKWIHVFWYHTELRKPIVFDGFQVSAPIPSYTCNQACQLLR